ncbi:hypothetical protein H4582DRAFT_2082262 [Lactarius indigo]|nr:hypothetical protein H4582DRAFT_2082262 [Lactarius indigo]
MPLDTDEDTPQPRITRSGKVGKKQKNKNTSQQAKPASATHSTPENGTGKGVQVVEEENEIMARIKKAKEELRKLKAQRDVISREITQAEASAVAASEPKIERPPKGVSIQVGMGLADDKPRYDAIRRFVRDLIGEAGINWELPWSDVPAVKKAKLYQAARKEIPYLAKFANDWPTQVLAMQLLKNKRGHSYRRGYLDVPERYAYLKKNAAMKKQRAQSQAQESHSTRSDIDQEEGEDDSEPADTSMPVARGSVSKRTAPVSVAAQPPRKKQKKASTAKSTRSMAKGKGKKRASTIETEDEDEAVDSDEVDVDMVDLEE